MQLVPGNCKNRSRLNRFYDFPEKAGNAFPSPGLIRSLKSTAKRFAENIIYYVIILWSRLDCKTQAWANCSPSSITVVNGFFNSFPIINRLFLL